MKVLILGFAKLAVFGLAGAMLVAMPAMAETITFYFTSDHCSDGCLPDGATNMGTVVVTDAGINIVDVTVQLTTGLGLCIRGREPVMMGTLRSSSGSPAIRQ